MGKIINPAGFLWAAVGILLCLGSVSLRLGTFQRPGPGFMPFLSGLAMVSLGFILVFNKPTQNLNKNGHFSFIKYLLKENRNKFILPLCLLFAYIMLFDFLGFVSASFLFLFAMFKMKDRRWLLPLLLSASVVLTSYFFFCVWLKAQFPKGISIIGI